MVNMGRKANNIIGEKYGKLTVIKRGYSDKKNLYWECKCECGELCYVTSSDLKRGRVNFCKKCNNEKSEKSALLILYNQYKKGSIKRGYKFDLTLNEFNKIIKQNCYYCGSEPKQKYHKKGMRYSVIYNGIDRQDNNIGYILGNCVPCCKFCNLAKSRFNLDEFIEWIESLKNN